MRFALLGLLSLFVVVGCQDKKTEKESVDLLVINANIYTVDA